MATTKDARLQRLSPSRPGWNLFRDGLPHGESPAQISGRADRLIARLRTLDGNVALFSHSHFGRVLVARWIGLPVAQAQHFLLDTASVSILCYEHNRTDQPAIALWNSAHEAFDLAANPHAADTNLSKEPALEQWENEGGEIPPYAPTKVAPLSTHEQPIEVVAVSGNQPTLGTALSRRRSAWLTLTLVP